MGSEAAVGLGGWTGRSLFACLALLLAATVPANPVMAQSASTTQPDKTERPDTAAPAGDADPAPADTVVVTGLRLKPEKLDTMIGDFVQVHGQHAPRTTQIARWDEPVCPLVQNVPADFAAFISTRIRAIAQAVGAPRAAPSCKTNVDIIFTDQPQAILDMVADKYPRLLGYHFVSRTKEMAQVTRPVQAWYVTATSNGVLRAIDDPYEGSIGGGLSSRLSTGDLRPLLAHILIVVDTDKILGRHLGTVADYLGVLALAQPKAVGQCGDLPSILDLFSGVGSDEQRPETLTAADKAYLEGLYSMDPREIGTLQRSSIAAHMRHSFGAPG
jgi:hypothetical protein